MSWKTILKLASLGLVLVLPLALSKPAPAPVGAPWLSVELPANPMERSADGAAMLIHAYHHGDQVGFPISGTAWGLVDGKRETVELEFNRTSTSGAYALKQQWPAEGNWVLGISVGTHAKADASLIIELGPGGGIAEDDYYGMSTKSLALGTVRVVKGGVDANKIDAALQSMAMRSGE